MKRCPATLTLLVILIGLLVTPLAAAPQATTYYSTGSAAPEVLSNWKTGRDGSGSSPVNFTSGDVFVIQNGHNMTTSAAWSISGSESKLWIEDGGTLTATYAVTLNSATDFQIDAGGTYVHNNTTAYGGSIFQGTESFAAASTVVLNSSNQTGPSSVTFGNLTINFTSDPGGVVNCAGKITTINGKLTVQSTNIREFRLTGDTNFTLNLAGDLIISGGTLDLASGTGAPTINIGGNFEQTGGTLRSSGGASTVVFTGGASSAVSFSTSGGAFTNTNLNWQIASGKTVALNTDFGAGAWVNSSRTMTVNGAFQINQDASPGNSGTWTYGSGATLIFNNTSGSYSVNDEAWWPTTNGPTNVTVQGGGGITMNTARTINGTLTLTSGLLTLGANHLTLGADATISGTPGASNMVVPTGSGELRKTFIGTGSFTFPVGDATDTAEYAPVTLNFTAGDFNSAYVGVRLVDAKHPNNTSATDYLSRYWTVTQSGISGFSCTVTFTYVDADIAGTEDNLYTGTWNGSRWTLSAKADSANNTIGGTVSSFSDFTGGEQGPLAVTLAAFAASATADGVTLAWETVSEQDNAGFNIYRAASDAGPWARLNPALISAATPGASAGHAYTWTDVTAAPGGAYWYQLEDVALDGTRTRHAPVLAAAAGAPNAVGLVGFGGAAATGPFIIIVLVVALGLAAAGARRRVGVGLEAGRLEVAATPAKSACAD